MPLVGDSPTKEDWCNSMSRNGMLSIGVLVVAAASVKSSRFNVQGSRWPRLAVSLNFEPGTLNIRAEVGHWDFSCSIH